MINGVIGYNGYGVSTWFMGNSDLEENMARTVRRFMVVQLAFLLEWNHPAKMCWLIKFGHMDLAKLR